MAEVWYELRAPSLGEPVQFEENELEAAYHYRDGFRSGDTDSPSEEKLSPATIVKVTFIAEGFPLQEHTEVVWS